MADISRTSANMRYLNLAIFRNFLAGTDLTVGDVVYIDSDGYVQPADANVSADVARGIGIVVASYDGETSVAEGHAVTVVQMGEVSGFSGMSEGEPGYVSVNAGRLADAVPAAGWTRIMGYAVSTQIFFVHPEVSAPSSG